MFLTTSLLLIGLDARSALSTSPIQPIEWSRLRLVEQNAPLRLPLWENGFTLKPDRMLTRTCVNLLHGMAGGQKLDPNELIPPELGLPPL